MTEILKGWSGWKNRLRIYPNISAALLFLILNPKVDLTKDLSGRLFQIFVTICILQLFFFIFTMNCRRDYISCMARNKGCSKKKKKRAFFTELSVTNSSANHTNSFQLNSRAVHFQFNYELLTSLKLSQLIDKACSQLQKGM